MRDNSDVPSTFLLQARRGFDTINAMSDTPFLASHDRPALHCPKCGGAMEVVLFKNIAIDRCTGCCGLWFDALERDQLMKIRGSEAIDRAAAPDARNRTTASAKFDCPVCTTAMVAMVDPKNWDLQYELCNACAGIFFDAGEFRECKEHRIFGIFREWMDRSA